MFDNYIASLDRALQASDSQFAFVGIIGSGIDGTSTTPHDIDVLILANAGEGRGKSYLSMVSTLDEADKHFAEHAITSRSPYKHLQAVTNFLITQETCQQPVDIHTLIYSDTTSFFTFNPARFVDYVKHNHITLQGSLDEALDQLPLHPDSAREEALAMLYQYNTLQNVNHLPSRLVLKQTDELVRYFNKIYGFSLPRPRSVSDCKSILVDIATGIDTERLETKYTRGEY